MISARLATEGATVMDTAEKIKAQLGWAQTNRAVTLPPSAVLPTASVAPLPSASGSLR